MNMDKLNQSMLKLKIKRTDAVSSTTTR